MAGPVSNRESTGEVLGNYNLVRLRSIRRQSLTTHIIYIVRRSRCRTYLRASSLLLQLFSPRLCRRDDFHTLAWDRKNRERHLHSAPKAPSRKPRSGETSQDFTHYCVMPCHCHVRPFPMARLASSLLHWPVKVPMVPRRHAEPRLHHHRPN